MMPPKACDSCYKHVGVDTVCSPTLLLWPLYSYQPL